MSLTLQQQIISRALALIEDEANWTRVYVCAIGALARAANELIEASGEVGIAKAFAAEKFILKANNRPYDTLPCINDSEGHAVILGMFKQALENAK